MKTAIFLPLLLILLITSCTNNQPALKIGELVVSKYEFERSLKKANQSDNKQNLKKWKEEYINKLLVIADAYAKKYDTLSAINNQVSFMSKFMMVQKYGYLWQSIISPKVDEFKIPTKEKIEKRKKLFYIDFIICENIDSLKTITHNDTILDIKKYNELKKQCNSKSFLKTGYISMQWPFLSFWKYKEYLFNQHEGTVSQLLHEGKQGIYIYLDHIEEINVDEKEKQRLQTELQIGIEKEIDDSLSIDIEKKTLLTLNDKNIGLLENFLDSSNNIFAYKTNLELLTYKLDQKEKKVDLQTFLDFLKLLPMQSVITNKAMLEEYLKQYVFDEYLNSEAIKLKLYEVDTFLISQKTFKENLMYSEYIQKEIFEKVQIDPSDIQNYYTKNASKYTAPKSIITNIFTFTNKDMAEQGLSQLKDLIVNNKLENKKEVMNINGLTNSNYNQSFDLSNNTLSNNLLAEIKALNIGEFSNIPQQYKGNWVIIQKVKEEGKVIQPFEELQKGIEMQLKAQESDKTLKVLVEKLRKQYPVTIDNTGIN
jgi:hypothetical protein